jgi:phosphatidate cytidylyltransferase
VGELKKRVLAGLIAGPVIALFFCFLPFRWLSLFLLLVLAVAVLELVDMGGVKDRGLLVCLTCLSAVPLYLRLFHVYGLWLMFAAVIYVGFKLLRGDGRKEGINIEIMRGTALLAGGSIFLVMPLFHFALLKEEGQYLPVILLLSLWGSDTAAYFVGRSLGRHPLVPQISPKKTVEGLLGAMGGSMVVMVLFGMATGMSPAFSLLVGAAIGVTGQLGDILESAVKRVCQVKDSSALIPGHGGVLDRIDSFIFAAPMFYCFVTGIRL